MVTVGKDSQQPALGCSQVSRMVVMTERCYRKLSREDTVTQVEMQHERFWKHKGVLTCHSC